MDETKSLFENMRDLIVVVRYNGRPPVEGMVLTDDEMDNEGKTSVKAWRSGGKKFVRDGKIAIYGAGEGTGVVISQEGHILTHIWVSTIELGVSVRRYGERHFYEAEVVATDSDNFLAILKVNYETKKPPFKFCRFGDCSALSKGMKMYSISQSFCVTYCMDQGTIGHPKRLGSELSSDTLLDTYLEVIYPIPQSATFIQLHGFSGYTESIGAPVFDSTGSVFGLIVLVRGQTFHFAIRSEILEKFCQPYQAPLQQREKVVTKKNQREKVVTKTKQREKVSISSGREK